MRGAHLRAGDDEIRGFQVRRRGLVCGNKRLLERDEELELLRLAGLGIEALQRLERGGVVGCRLGLDPELVADLLDVLVALGAVELRADGAFAVLPEFEPFRSGSLSRVVRAGVRSDHLQTAEAFRRARDGSLEPGWEHRDPELLIAQGETAGLFRLAAEHVLPSLDGLADRLARAGARFLDVGAGVGVLSRELLLVYPEVSAVCVEPNATARAIGQERFHEAGLADRVGFVSHGVEDLSLAEVYDLALMPQPFFSPRAFDLGLANVLRSLRPGGWLVVLTLDLPRADSLAAASRRVRGRLWGGGAVDCERLLERLAAAGFESAHAHPPVGDYRMLAARRPSVPSSTPSEVVEIRLP